MTTGKCSSQAFVQHGHYKVLKTGLTALLAACAVLLGLAGCATHSVVHQPYRVVENAHSGGNALAIDPTGQLGASGGWSGRVRLWRLQDGEPLGRWSTGHGDLYGLVFLDGNQLLTAGFDGFVRVWTLDGTLVREFNPGAAITSFRATGDRSHIAIGHDDGMVTLWHVGGERLGGWRLSERRIAAVAVKEDLSQLAASDTASNVWRWTPDGAPQTVASPPTYPRSLLFHPETGTLMGSGWFKLYAWRDGGSALTVLDTDHFGIINHLELSPNQAYLASISRINDSAVLLLDPKTGDTLAAFRKHALCGQRVALSPDGRIMMSSSDDASVRFYSLLPVESDLRRR